MPVHFSVIIPAYNEQERIIPTLASVHAYLSELGNFEVLVVSDGSTDETVARVNVFAATHPGITVIENRVNAGKGAAVRDGMLAARGNLCVFIDADGSTSIRELPNMVPYIRSEAPGGTADVVIGSVGIPGARTLRYEPSFRMLLGRVGNALIRFLVLPGIYDTQRGFKVFRREVAQEVFSRLSITRWGFDIEALALARARGFSIKEVPVPWVHTKGTKVRASAYLQTLYDLFRIWLRLGKQAPQDL